MRFEGETKEDTEAVHVIGDAYNRTAIHSVLGSSLLRDGEEVAEDRRDVREEAFVDAKRGSTIGHNDDVPVVEPNVFILHYYGGSAIHTLPMPQRWLETSHFDYAPRSGLPENGYLGKIGWDVDDEGQRTMTNGSYMQMLR